jgi:hypothetical protein
MDEFINQNLKELKSQKNNIEKPTFNKNNSTIKDILTNLNQFQNYDNVQRKPFFKSIFNNKPNNNIQIEYLHEFDLSNIEQSLDDLFTKESILVNNAFCSDIFHINLNKYLTQYISFLVFNNPHFHLVFKNMKFIKEQIHGMKQSIKKNLLTKSFDSKIVNVVLNIQLNIKNIEQLSQNEIELFKSKEIKKFEITFLLK